MLTGPHNRPIYINPHEVSSLREADQGQIAEGIRCIVIMTNGKTNGTAEDCPEVHKTIGEGHRTDVGQPPCTLVCAGNPR